MTNMRNPAAGGSGASGRVSYTKNTPRIPAAAPHFNRRAAFLDAVWDASTTYAAATTAAILTHVIGHLRQHPEFDRLGLGRTVDRIGALRDQADDATLHVGRAAMNQAIDEVVAAIDGQSACGRTPPPTVSLASRRQGGMTPQHAAKRGAQQNA